MRRSWAVAGVLAVVIAAAALGAAYWLAVTQNRPEMAYAVTLACLAFAVVFLVMQRHSSDGERAEQLDGLIRRGGDLVRALEHHQRGQASFGRAEPSLRPQALHMAPPPPRREPAITPPQPQKRVSEHPSARALPLNDTLDLYLEPIVDLGSRQTVHYRASMSLMPAQGERIAHDALYEEADRGGLRPALDVFAVSRSARVVEKLKRSRPELRLFLPIGRATLSDNAALQAIERDLNQQSRVAQAIAFEIGFDTLAGLDPQGVSGLARLARIGGSLALGKAWNAELDLASLRASRFQFLCFDMTALTEEPSVPPAWTPLAQHATREGFDIIATHADTEVLAAEARRHAGFARGAAFSPPRLVKAELFSAPRRAAA